MADLLAKQDQKKAVSLARGEEVEGVVINISDQEVILDLGTKSEGVLLIKDLPENISPKVGDKIKAFVLSNENESGQILLNIGGGPGSKFMPPDRKWDKFIQALKSEQSFKGTGVEVNKGGLIVEINGVRGFLPASQTTFSAAANLDELIGQEVEVTVLEADPSGNRLIFSQKKSISDDLKKTLDQLEVGDKVEGKVAAILPFGVFVSVESVEDEKKKDIDLKDIEGLVHISEISWERLENPSQVLKIGDSVKASVVSVDTASGRVNLSIKRLSADPFAALSEKFQTDDVVKGKVTKITSLGVSVSLTDGVEGFVPAAKLDPSVTYEVEQETNFLVDNVDSSKRRVNLTPFLTSTEGLIYK